MDTVTILSPAFNEEKNIPLFIEHFISKIPEYWQVLIVNDGSTDNSKNVLEKLTNSHSNLKAINHNTNLGFGKAINTGLKHVSTDYLITIDCDMSHQFDLVEILYNNRKKSDIVIASLSDKNSEYESANKFRVLIAKLGSFVLSYMFGLKVKEIAGGPRIYNFKKFDNLELKSKGFEVQTEILIELNKKGLSMSNCEIILGNRKYGVSKMNYSKTIYEIIKLKLF